ncbi:MAG: ankyrin repeat domain-containing protein [Endomicrobia bacterium]|nr:ankyrin repeat domain-containing protein [Endomicrobiia bacterium]
MKILKIILFPMLLLLFFPAFLFAQGNDKPLIHAVKDNEYEKVLKLLARGENPNVKDFMGNSALVIAVNNGNEKIAEALIKKEADPSASYMRGMSVLMLAINKKLENTANLLIKHGADVTAKLSNGTDALMLAAEKNLISVAKNIIGKKHIDVNARNSEGLSPLSIAIKNRNMEMARFLYKNKAKTSNILEAVAVSDLDSVKGFLRLGASIETKGDDDMTPLLIAYSNEDYRIADFLIDEYRANINARNAYGLSPALIAAMKNNSELVIRAMQAHADLSVRDINGLNPLMFAIFAGNHSLVDKMLLYEPSAVNNIDKNFNTPLSIAVSLGDEKMVKRLTDDGAYLNSKNAKRALNVAIDSGNLVIAEFLIRKGARVNAKDLKGVSPMMVAINNADPAAVKFLIKKGAKINIRDKNGYTPLDYAKERGNVEIIALLTALSVSE